MQSLILSPKLAKRDLLMEELGVQERYYALELNEDLASVRSEIHDLGKNHRVKAYRLRNTLGTRCKEKQHASDILFIDCDTRDHRIPGLAYCAIIDKPRDFLPGERPRVIYHFCSRHTLPEDPMSGPQGLVKSLNYQLLTDNDIHITPSIIEEAKQEDAKTANLRVLRRLIKTYFKQKPNSILACIIDGATCYDTKEWRGGMEEVFNLLGAQCR